MFLRFNVNLVVILAVHITFGCSHDTNLKLVHVVFRHGARTPDKPTYPNDLHANETFKPYGWGQLTNIGKQQMYELGQFLRDRYDDFLGEELDVIDDLYAQTTQLPRHQISLQLMLAGLFPPKKTTLEWNKNLNWLPIHYKVVPFVEDILMLPHAAKPCPRYNQELKRVLREDFQSEIDDEADMLRELSIHSGWNITTPKLVRVLYSILNTEEGYGLELPQWAKKFYPEKMRNLNDKGFSIEGFNSELKRFKGGNFVKKTIEDWKHKADGQLNQKIFVYSASDTSVVNILSAFNVWEQQLPDYGIAAIFELGQHKLTKEYGIEIFLRNSTLTQPAQLNIPGCSSFCLLSDLEEILTDNIPKDSIQKCDI